MADPQTSDQILSRARAQADFFGDLSRLPGYKGMTPSEIVDDFSSVLTKGQRSDIDMLVGDMLKYMPAYKGMTSEDVLGDLRTGFGRRASGPEPSQQVPPVQPAAPTAPKPERPESEPQIARSTQPMPVGPEAPTPRLITQEAPGAALNRIDMGAGLQPQQAQSVATATTPRPIQASLPPPDVEEREKEVYHRVKEMAQNGLKALDDAINKIPLERRTEPVSFTGEPATAEQYQRTTIDPEYGRLVMARRYLQQVVDHPEKYQGPGDILRGAMSTIKDGSVIPIVGDLMKVGEAFAVKAAAAKPEEQRTPDEKALVDAYAALQTVQSVPGVGSMGYDIGRGAAEMIPYAAYFGMTEPVYQVAKSFAQKGLIDALGRGTVKNIMSAAAKNEAMALAQKAGLRAIPATIGGAVQSLTNVPGIAQNFLERTLPKISYTLDDTGQKLVKVVGDDAESQISKLLKAIGTNASDFVTERWGIMAEKPMEFLKRTLVGEFRARVGIRAIDKAIDIIRERSAFNGFVGEVFEEWIQAPIQTWIETGKPQLMPNDDLLRTMGVMAIPTALGLAGHAAGMGADVATQGMRERAAQRVRQQQAVDFAAAFPLARVREIAPTGEFAHVQEARDERYQQYLREQQTQVQAELNRRERIQRKEEVRKGFEEARKKMREPGGVLSEAQFPTLDSGAPDYERMRNDLYEHATQNIPEADKKLVGQRIAKLNEAQVGEEWARVAKLKGPGAVAQNVGKQRENYLRALGTAIAHMGERAREEDYVRSELKAADAEAPGGPLTQAETDRLMGVFKMHVAQRAESEDKYKAVIQAAGMGAEFGGLWKPSDRVEAQVQFDDPITGSTLYVKASELTPENVRQHIAESRRGAWDNKFGELRQAGISEETIAGLIPESYQALLTQVRQEKEQPAKPPFAPEAPTPPEAGTPFDNLPDDLKRIIGASGKSVEELTAMNAEQLTKVLREQREIMGKNRVQNHPKYESLKEQADQADVRIDDIYMSDGKEVVGFTDRTTRHTAALPIEDFTETQISRVIEKKVREEAAAKGARPEEGEPQPEEEPTEEPEPEAEGEAPTEGEGKPTKTEEAAAKNPAEFKVGDFVRDIYRNQIFKILTLGPQDVADLVDVKNGRVQQFNAYNNQFFVRVDEDLLPSPMEGQQKEGRTELYSRLSEQFPGKIAADVQRNGYWYLSKDGQYKKVEKATAVKIPGYARVLDLFAFKDPKDFDRWNITDALTGLAYTRGARSKQVAIEAVAYMLDNQPWGHVETKLRETIEKYGPSPRYTPKRKKAQAGEFTTKGEVGGETTAAGGVETAAPAPPLTKQGALDQAIQETGAGLKSAIDALDALFGGPSLKSFPGGIDEATLREARQHLEQAWTHFQNAGKSFKEFFDLLVQRYGERIVTYLRAVFPKEVNEIRPTLSTGSVEPVKVEFFKKIQFLDDVRQAITAGKRLDKTALEKLAEKAGIDDKRLAREYGEVAILGLAREIVEGEGSEEDKLRGLVTLYNNQPNLTHRTTETVELQQYSTPVPMGYVMGVYTDAQNPAKSVFEPSSGPGGLVFMAARDNTNVNEIDPVRLGTLYNRDFGLITSVDASEPMFDRAKMFDVVHTNPPFGEAPMQTIDGYTFKAKEHIMTARALDTMKDDGRAAIIIGGHNEFDNNGLLKGRDRVFMNWLYHFYNVGAVMNVHEDMYAKQGAHFPIRIILVNGRKAQPSGAAPLFDERRDAVLQSFEDIYRRMKEVQNEVVVRPEGAIQTGPGGIPGNEPGRQGETRPTRGVPAGKARPSRPGGRAERGEPGRGGEGVPAGGRGVFGAESEGDRRGGAPIGNAPSVDRGGQAENEDRVTPNADRHDAERRPANLQGDKPTIVFGDDALVVDYTPMSQAQAPGSVVSSAMADDTYRALRSFVERNGDIDEYVRKKLNYPSVEDMWEKLDGVQIDAVAMAIEKVENGEGFIIGDQTGLGKGREGSAVLYWAHQAGGPKPIYLTKNSDLISELYRDLKAIGAGHLKPFIVNTDGEQLDADGKPVYSTPQLNEHLRVLQTGDLTGYDYVIASYSQFQNPELYPLKPQFLSKIAEGAVIIMDESHETSGEQSNRRLVFDPIIQKKAKGIVYMSATWAKRASNMPIYAYRTGMRLVQANPRQIEEAFATGGVPLQEVTSADLAESGDMIRRARRFEGSVEYRYLEAEAPQHERTADAVTDILRDIIMFQRGFVTPMIDAMNQDLRHQGGRGETTQGTQEAGISNSDFASRVHNVIEQMLFALKVDAVAKEAINQFQNGKKPVIALRNTMQAFIEGMGYTDQEVLDKPDFALTLLRGLNTVMRYTEQTAQGGKETHEIAPDALPPIARQEYDRLVRKIKETSAGIPASPIDYLEYKLKEAGLKIGEVTKRHLTMEYKKGPDGKEYAVVKSRIAPRGTDVFRKFNNGEYDVLILNQSGATGMSAHSSVTFKDQRPRVMIIQQPELDITQEQQKRGRIDRKGQVHPGEYIYMATTIPAELRLMMMLQKKMKSLDANVTSKQRSVFTMNLVDFLNKYGDRVAVAFLKENRDMVLRLGDPFKFRELQEEEIERMLTKENAAMTVARRAQILPVKEQRDLYEEMAQRYEDYIAYLKETGEYDLEMEATPLDARVLNKELLMQGAGGTSAFGRDTFLEEVEVNVLRKPYTKAELDKAIQDRLGKQTGKQVADQMVAEFETWFEENRRRVLEEFDQRTGEGTGLDAVKRAEQRNKVLKRWDALKTHTEFVLKNFLPGEAMAIPRPEGDQSVGNVGSPGVVLGVVIDKRRKNPYAPSAIKVLFAVNDPRRFLPIPSSQKEFLYAAIGLTTTQYGSARARQGVLEGWDKGGFRGDRERRYVVTGNMLQYYTKPQKRKGRLISYTTHDGQIARGVLLPHDFDASEVAYVRVAVNRAVDYIANYPIDQGVELESGIELMRDRQGNFTMSVPKAKQKGGTWFLDKDILKFVEGHRFDSFGQEMRATILAHKLEKVLDILATKFGEGIRIPRDQAQRGNDKDEISLAMDLTGGLATGAYKVGKRIVNAIRHGTSEPPLDGVQFADSEIMHNLEKSGKKGRDLIKTFGIPFFLGERYAGFGPRWYNGHRVEDGVFGSIDRYAVREYAESVALILENDLNSWKEIHDLKNHPESASALANAAMALNETAPEDMDVSDDVLRTKYGLDDRAVAAWHQFRAAYESAFEIRRELDRYIIIERGEYKPRAIDFKVLTRDKLLTQGLGEDETDQVMELLKDGIFKLTKDQRSALWQIREVREVVGNALIEKKYARNYLANFFSMSRPGDHTYAVVAREPATDTGDVFDTEEEEVKEPPVYLATFGSSQEANEHANYLKSQGYTGPDLNAPITVSRIDRDFISRHTKLFNLDQLYEVAESAGISIADETLQRLAKEIQSRGFDRHLMRRRRNPGFQWDLPTMEKAAMEYIVGAARRYAKYKGLREAQDALRKFTADPRIPGHVQNFARAYLDSYVLSSPVEFEMLRQTIYTATLGLSVSNLVQNTLQPLLTTYNEIPLMLKEAGKKTPGLTEVVFFDAYRYAMSHLLERAGKYANKDIDILVPQAWKEYAERARRQGVLQPLQLEQVAGIAKDPRLRYPSGTRSEKKLKKFWRVYTSILALGTRLSETLNREHAMFTGLLIGEKYLGLQGNDLYEYAIRTVQRTQFVFGTYNVPLAFRQMTPPTAGLKPYGSQILRNAGRLIYMLKSFDFNYLGRAGLVARSKSVGSIVRALGAIVTMSGWRGLPLVGMMYALWNWVLFLIGDDETAEEKERKVFKPIEKAVGLPERSLSTGPVGAMTGIETSRLLGAGNPVSGFSPRDIGGVVVGQAQKLQRSAEAAKEGEFLRALENLPILPRVATNILRAQRAEEEGLISQGGFITQPKEELSEADINKMRLGFTPLSSASAYERQRAERKIGIQGREFRDRALDEYVRALARGDRQAQNDVLKEIVEFNRGAKIEDIVNPASIVRTAYLRLAQVRRNKRQIPAQQEKRETFQP